MKQTLSLVAVLVSMAAQAQFVGTRTNTSDSTQERYVTNSPLNIPGSSRVIEKLRDSTYHRLLSRNVLIDRLGSAYNDGVATNVVFTTASGELRRGSFPAAPAPDSSIFATRYYVNSQGYLVSESDPIWTAASSNYWTKTQADARYLQAETDPVWTAASGNYYTKTQADARYLQVEVDGSTTNELKTLSIMNRTISISSGNNVVVPYPAYDSLTGKPVLPGTFRDSVEYYNSSGRINQKIKVWNGIVTPNVANGFNVDISAAAFTTILSVQAQAINNGSVAASLPIVIVKSYTTTQVSLNILQSNSQLISLLGITVTGLIFATSLSGTTLAIQVTGY